jgi:hypothetical protein
MDATMVRRRLARRGKMASQKILVDLARVRANI